MNTRRQSPPPPPPPPPAVDPIIELQREFVAATAESLGISLYELARRSGVHRSTLTTLFQPSRKFALSSRTLAAIAAGGGVAIPPTLASTMAGRLDQEVLWLAFEAAMKRAPQRLLSGDRRWRAIVDAQARAYDFLIERREAGQDIRNPELLAAVDFIVRQEIDRRRNE